jgi:hypothetical protein
VTILPTPHVKQGEQIDAPVEDENPIEPHTPVLKLAPALSEPAEDSVAPDPSLTFQDVSSGYVPPSTCPTMFIPQAKQRSKTSGVFCVMPADEHAD